MSGGRDEVDAGVDARVWDGLLAVDAHFLVEVLLKLIVHKLQHRHPTAPHKGRRNVIKTPYYNYSPWFSVRN